MACRQRCTCCTCFLGNRLLVVAGGAVLKWSRYSTCSTCIDKQWSTT